MDFKKKFILPVVMVMALGLALAGGAYVKAEAATTSDSGTHKTIIQRLVERFNLNTADVQAVFDAEKTDRQTEMKAKEEAQLTQLVTDGKITEAQKQLIVAKRAEMEANRPAEPAKDSTLTPTQRKAEMEARRTALETWAKENGIDTQYLYLLGGFGHMGHGHEFGGMMGEPPAPTGN
jgi:hypothetical protein